MNLPRIFLMIPFVLLQPGVSFAQFPQAGRTLVGPLLRDHVTVRWNVEGARLVLVVR